MHQETELIKETRLYAEQLLQKCTMGKFPYHNHTHTHTVVDAVREIGKKSDLSHKDLETVEIAAWLHDVGLSSGKAEGHEELGAEMARAFLMEQSVGENRIEKIANCILATKMPQQPDNLLAEVLCDADLYHLSTDIYLEKAELLRQEVCIVKQGEINAKDWLSINIQFLKNHTYFTAYGRETLQPRQDKNLRKLEKKVRKQQEQEQEGEKEESKSKWEKKNEELRTKLEEEKTNKPGRGVETMFRTTAANHLHLSEMADNKANIMISINSIIVSLMVTVLIRKFEEFPNLILPTAILTIVCLVTIVFAVLATRPNVSSGLFTREDIQQKKTNLLFFGNFYQMSLANYEWGMQETMKDSELLYSSMIRDIYFLGKVLGRKYRLLHTSYTVFMFGFVISVLSYAIALIFFPVAPYMRLFPRYTFRSPDYFVSYAVCCLFVFLFMLTACGQSGKSKKEKNMASTFKYDLNHPDEKFFMPDDLEEISGLSYYRANQLACVQDEDGKIFIFDTQQKRVVRQIRFARKGDYEGIEVVNENIYVVKSDGTLYRCPLPIPLPPTLLKQPKSSLPLFRSKMM